MKWKAEHDAEREHEAFSRKIDRGIPAIRRLQAQSAALHAMTVAEPSPPRLIDPVEREARRRAAQELREMGEPEAALICEAGLQFPSD